MLMRYCSVVCAVNRDDMERARELARKIRVNMSPGFPPLIITSGGASEEQTARALHGALGGTVGVSTWLADNPLRDDEVREHLEDHNYEMVILVVEWGDQALRLAACLGRLATTDPDVGRFGTPEPGHGFRISFDEEEGTYRL